MHTVDIRNRAAVEELLAALRPDRVLLLAAQASRPIADREPDRTEEINILGTRRVAEAIGHAEPRPQRGLRLLPARVRPRPGRARSGPSTPTAPQGDLAHLSKIYGELSLRMHAERHGFDVALLRLGHRLRRLAGRARRAAVADRRRQVPPHGRPRRAADDRRRRPGHHRRRARRRRRAHPAGGATRGRRGRATSSQRRSRWATSRRSPRAASPRTTPGGRSPRPSRTSTASRSTCAREDPRHRCDRLPRLAHRDAARRARSRRRDAHPAREQGARRVLRSAASTTSSTPATPRRATSSPAATRCCTSPGSPIPRERARTPRPRCARTSARPSTCSRPAPRTTRCSSSPRPRAPGSILLRTPTACPSGSARRPAGCTARAPSRCG